MHWTTVVTSRFVFLHWFFITVNIFLANSGILLQILGVSSMSGIWCVGCLQINREEFADLCNAISLKFERADEVSCIPICIWLTSLILIFLFHVCFLRWISGEVKCAECMSQKIVGQSVKRVNPFRPRVDVVPDYRLIKKGSISQSFDHTACIHDFSVCTLIMYVQPPYLEKYPKFYKSSPFVALKRFVRSDAFEYIVIGMLLVNLVAVIIETTVSLCYSSSDSLPCACLF